MNSYFRGEKRGMKRYYVIVVLSISLLLNSYCFAEEKTKEDIIEENEDLRRELTELKKQFQENQDALNYHRMTTASSVSIRNTNKERDGSYPERDKLLGKYYNFGESPRIPKINNPEDDLRSSSQKLTLKDEIVETTILLAEETQSENTGMKEEKGNDNDKDEDEDEIDDQNENDEHVKEEVKNEIKGEDKQEDESQEDTTNETAIMDMEEQKESELFVITPTRTKQLLKNTGSSVSIITEKDIKNSNEPLLLEVLRKVRGIEVARTGGIGGATSVFMRGASSAQTLVFIDGIQMNSPTTGAFNFANLTTDNIERVEILSGPQSTLYGSEAIGGVVNIFTKRGSGDNKIRLGTEYGMHDTYRESAHISGGRESFDYSAGASYLRTHGISSASSGDEADGYENFTGSVNLGWNFLEDGRINTTARGTHSELEYDAFQFGVGPVDDPDRSLDTDEIIFSTKVRKTFFDIWTPSFLFSVNDTELKGFDLTDSAGEFRIPTQVWRFEHQSDFTLFDRDTITIGYEHEVLKGENAGNFDETFRNNSVFFQNQIKLLESLYWTAGLRYDDYSTFGSNLTYKTTASYNVERIGSRFHGSWGTGFRAPSLNELFFPFFGNPDLGPEESKGWDFGIEKEILKDTLIIDVTYFENDFTDLIAAAIQPDGSFMAENVNRAKSEGVETVITYKPFSKISFTGTYTYTETEDREKDQQLPRRPRNRATLGITTQPLEKWNVNVAGVMVRDRIDSDGTKMDNYWTADLMTSYDITKLMTAYIRIENLFDYDYEEITGFSSLGFTAYGGLEFKF
ncbi:MAG: TonB-dependent receptor [wastewater metagenome]|nr:TonB-dependent receptor [Candidatus Loosdrechtia aerotolerans]